MCGGVACIMRGVARATHDLNIAVAMETRDLRGIVRMARKPGLRPRVPEPLEALLDADRLRAWVEQNHAVV